MKNAVNGAIRFYKEKLDLTTLEYVKTELKTLPLEKLQKFPFEKVTPNFSTEYEHYEQVKEGSYNIYYKPNTNTVNYANRKAIEFAPMFIIEFDTAENAASFVKSLLKK